ncbi:hypothetical protein [Pseudidiomarina donghaiensis]|uniref:Uncharacterized protein n=1 Tax=Pseudidiomarina donghaiensis TaxID=519452 RepID=A0A432XL45_9GAMM|nr:hypothetical protein [Pseudidiomarina donghaiensis]RUO49409.1 hypothetical protein CWE24_02600 [Pseudidiomarina donghaiensis]SFV21178.1 hypothetical protein SAMN04488139_0655 [Pseudidiomarina donghaiensis]
MKKDVEVRKEEVLETLRDVVEFARSVLHLPFPVLEDLDPSFGSMARWADLLASLFKDKEDAIREFRQAEKMVDALRGISEAIVDRDDGELIDYMAILDQFLDDTRKG